MYIAGHLTTTYTNQSPLFPQDGTTATAGTSTTTHRFLSFIYRMHTASRSPLLSGPQSPSVPRRLPTKLAMKNMYLDAVGELAGSPRRASNRGAQWQYLLNAGQQVGVPGGGGIDSHTTLDVPHNTLQSTSKHSTKHHYVTACLRHCRARRWTSCFLTSAGTVTTSHATYGGSGVSRCWLPYQRTRAAVAGAAISLPHRSPLLLTAPAALRMRCLPRAGACRYCFLWPDNTVQ